jgi:hypothetical protein
VIVSLPMGLVHDPSDGSTSVSLTGISGVVQLDSWLEPYKDALRSRYNKAQLWIKKIGETEGGLEKFSKVGLPRSG